jgi:phosphoribosylformimino-5-aminoimidazole carboxamide ribotide isomerase
MRLVPVVDLRSGQAVRAVAGLRRDEYPPLESALAEQPGLRGLAAGLAAIGPTAVYVADLDALEGRPPNEAAYRVLGQSGAALWIDAGLRSLREAQRLIEACGEGAPSCHVIAALETIPSPQVLAELVALVGRERLIFSLDLRHGQPLCGIGWGAGDPLAVAAVALETGVRRMIVLDLAAVGSACGTPTLDLCRQLRASSPSNLQLITGGGVRGLADLEALAAAGCDAALVGATLHSGRITAAEFRRWHAARRR